MDTVLPPDESKVGATHFRVHCVSCELRSMKPGTLRPLHGRLIMNPFAKSYHSLGAKRFRRDYRAEDACRGPWPR